MAELSFGLHRYSAPIGVALISLAATAAVAGGIWLYASIYDQSHQIAVQNAAAQIGRCGYGVGLLVSSHHLVTGQDGRPVALLPDGSLDQVVLLATKKAGPGDTLTGMSEGPISTKLAGALDAANFGTGSRYADSSLLSVNGEYLVAGGVAGREELCPTTEQAHTSNS